MGISSLSSCGCGLVSVVPGRCFGNFRWQPRHKPPRGDRAIVLINVMQKQQTIKVPVSAIHR